MQAILNTVQLVSLQSVPSRKGSPNRPKRLLLARLREEFPDYEPVLETARAAHRLSALAIQAEESSAPPTEVATFWKDAGTQHEKVAQYVTPKLKAVEVTGPGGGPVQQSLTVEYVDSDSESVQGPTET